MQKLLFACVLLLSFALAVNYSLGNTTQNFSVKMMHYFENKNDDIIYETLKFYNDNQESNEHFLLLTAMFFSGIKQSDKTKFDRFYKIVQESSNANLANVFQTIDEFDLPAYLENIKQAPSPDGNDTLWALFFSSGDTAYLDILFQTIQDFQQERVKLTPYLAAHSGLWSLKLNCKDYPAVQKYFDESTILSKEIKNYISKTDADTINQHMIQLLKQQRAKGIWLNYRDDASFSDTGSIGFRNEDFAVMVALVGDIDKTLEVWDTSDKSPVSLNTTTSVALGDRNGITPFITMGNYNAQPMDLQCNISIVLPDGNISEEDVMNNLILAKGSKAQDVFFRASTQAKFFFPPQDYPSGIYHLRLDILDHGKYIKTLVLEFTVTA
jgi:hypothetical protein